MNLEAIFHTFIQLPVVEHSMQCMQRRGALGGEAHGRSAAAAVDLVRRVVVDAVLDSRHTLLDVGETLRGREVTGRRQGRQGRRLQSVI